MTTSTATPTSASSLDRLLQARQARFTSGFSPASLLVNKAKSGQVLRRRVINRSEE